MDIRKTKIPKAVAVEPLNNLILRVVFEDGTIKLHDAKPYLEKFEVFNQLLDEDLFKSVYANGYAVAWNDEIDLSILDVLETGISVPT